MDIFYILQLSLMMTKKLRNPFISLVLLGLTAAAVTSCENSTTSSSDRSFTPFAHSALIAPVHSRNPYSWVGTHHNAALNFVLADLSHIKNARQLPESAILKLVENRTMRYLASSGIVASPAALQAGSASVPGPGRSGLSPSDYAADGALSVQAAAYAEQIVAMVQDESIPLSDLYARLAALEIEATGQLGATELEIVLSVSAVGASSATYWEQTSGWWVDQYSEGGPAVLLGSDGLAPMGRISWRMVAGHDALGAFSGAIAAAATGAGIPAGAVGGAACASTVSALGQLLL
jgi:hypothetical protein